MFLYLFVSAERNDDLAGFLRTRCGEGKARYCVFLFTQSLFSSLTIPYYTSYKLFFRFFLCSSLAQSQIVQTQSFRFFFLLSAHPSFHSVSFRFYFILFTISFTYIYDRIETMDLYGLADCFLPFSYGLDRLVTRILHYSAHFFCQIPYDFIV